MTSEKETVARSYCTLKEAKEILNRSEEDILFLGCTGELPINVLTDSLEVFSESIPIKSNPCENDLEDETEIIVNHDKENQVAAYNLRVSTKSIKRLAAHDLDARIIIEPLKYDESTMIYFNIINSTHEVPRIKDCKLIILKNDIEAFLLLNTVTLSGSVNLIPEATESLAIGGTKTPKLGQSKKTSPYELRKRSCDAWLKVSQVTIEVLTQKTILNQLQQHDPITWGIELSSFRKDFWQRYRKENGIILKSGRPPKR